MEKIAIVVPIYNVENYLRECLDSIRNQTYKNFICIMINDGSTDSSKKIAETYLVDERFVLINQENQGLSGARNRGIEFLLKNTEKEYSIDFVSFVDSDDVVSSNFLEELIKHIDNDIDIIEANITDIIENSQPVFLSSNVDEFILEATEDKLMNILNHGIRVSIFPRLIRLRLLSLNFFPKGKIYEDLAVMPELISLSKKWKKIPNELYGYRIRQNSITTEKFSKKKLVIFSILKHFKKYYKNHSKEIRVLVEKICIDHLRWHKTTSIPKWHFVKIKFKYHILKSRVKLKLGLL